jgi:hypothetical protein
MGGTPVSASLNANTEHRTPNIELKRRRSLPIFISTFGVGCSMFDVRFFLV